MQTREELLAKLKEEFLRKPEIKIITTDEYTALREIASFECPKKKDMRFCEGKDCPVRPEDQTLDYWEQCTEARRIRLKLDKVLNGKIAVANGNNGWSIPV